MEPPISWIIDCYFTRLQNGMNWCKPEQGALSNFRPVVQDAIGSTDVERVQTSGIAKFSYAWCIGLHFFWCLECSIMQPNSWQSHHLCHQIPAVEWFSMRNPLLHPAVKTVLSEGFGADCTDKQFDSVKWSSTIKCSPKTKNRRKCEQWKMTEIKQHQNDLTWCAQRLQYVASRI